MSFNNSLAPGRFQQNLRKIIFNLILVTDGYDISSEIALRWTSLDLSDDKSTFVPLKFHTKHLIHTLKDMQFIGKYKLKGSYIYKLVTVFKRPPPHPALVLLGPLLLTLINLNPSMDK